MYERPDASDLDRLTLVLEFENIAVWRTPLTTSIPRCSPR